MRQLSWRDVAGQLQQGLCEQEPSIVVEPHRGLNKMVPYYIMRPPNPILKNKTPPLCKL